MVTGLGPQLLQTDAQRYTTVIAHGLFSGFQQFSNEAHPVFSTAAIFVAAMVVLFQQKFIAQVTHTSVDIDYIETGAAGAPGCINLPADNILYVFLIHDAWALITHETHMRSRPGNAAG